MSQPTKEELLAQWRTEMSNRMPTPAEKVLVAALGGEGCSRERLYFGWRSAKRDSAAKELLAREFESNVGCRPEDLVRA